LVVSRLCLLRAHGRPITYAKGKEEGERIQRRSYETDKEENKRVKYRQIQPWS
jgi:hypothetical protein